MQLFNPTNTVGEWNPDPLPTVASWTRNIRNMPPEVGKTYTFEAVFEVTKSNNLVGSQWVMQSL